MEKKFKCKKCDGDGYVDVWGSDDSKFGECLELKDCDVCQGLGHIMIDVVDSRVVSKDPNLKVCHRIEY